MIKRTYFVGYTGNGGMVGSVTFTSTSWFSKPAKVFVNAVDFLAKEHPGCVITKFHRI